MRPLFYHIWEFYHRYITVADPFDRIKTLIGFLFGLNIYFFSEFLFEFNIKAEFSGLLTCASILICCIVSHLYYGLGTNCRRLITEKPQFVNCLFFSRFIALIIVLSLSGFWVICYSLYNEYFKKDEIYLPVDWKTK